MTLSPVLHLNGPEYGVSDYTGATSPFHNGALGEADVNYKYDGLASLQFLASEGWPVVKLPIRWERIQDTISGPLRQVEVDLLTGFLDRAETAGVGVIIDVHNYGAYYEGVGGVGTRRMIGSDELPVSAFADLWGRMAEQFGDHPAVAGYALMAEPVALDGFNGPTWREASQAAVEAIREHDMTTEVHVAGFDWSTTRYWAWHNGPTAWITDPANKVRYEAHHYWDADASGEYADSYADTLDAAESTEVGTHHDALHAKVMSELKGFTDWLTANNAKGIVGELGWPVTDGADWNRLAETYFEELAAHDIPAVGWFAGEWAWSEHDTRIYEGTNPLNTPRGQMTIWSQHL